MVRRHNGKFPIIKNFEDIKDFIIQGFQAKEYPINNNNSIISIDYLYQSPELFKNFVNREFRGITFDGNTGKILSRPLHKFFNLGELDDIKDYDRDIKILTIEDKLDGSMIHSFLIPNSKDNKVKFKTRKSPYSNTVIGFENWIKEQPFYEEFIDFNKQLLLSGYTPIFEFYHKDYSQIVVEYPNNFVRLLAIRETISGQYKEFELIEDLKKEYPNLYEKYEIIKLPIEKYPTDITIEDLIKLSEKLENKEGWVIIDNNHERYKLKVMWYLERHKFFKITPKNVIEWFLNDELDDIIANLKIYKYEHKLGDVLEIKQKIENVLNEKIHKEILENCLLNKSFNSKKELAIYLNTSNNCVQIKKQNPLFNVFFGYLMRNIDDGKLIVFDTLKINELYNNFIEFLKKDNKNKKKLVQIFKELLR